VKPAADAGIALNPGPMGGRGRRLAIAAAALLRAHLEAGNPDGVAALAKVCYEQTGIRRKAATCVAR